MTEPAWENAGYVGIFGDAYVSSTELEGGHIVTALAFLSDVLKRLHVRVGDHSELSKHVKQLGDICKASVEMSTLVLKAQKPEELLPLLQQWVGQIRDTPQGHVLMVPGGWRGTTNGWIVYLVEKKSDHSYSVSVCNRGPSGAQYHPTRMFPDGARGQKLKSMATIHINDVPMERMTDAGFWAMVFAQWVPNPSEYHRAEVVYDVILPWLAGITNGEKLTNKLSKTAAAATWRTPCKSNTACAKSILEAFRYLCRSWGLSEASAKRVSILIRQEALLKASEDLIPRTRMSLPEAQEAVHYLQGLGVSVVPRLLWSRLRPAAISAMCKLVVLFFSVPGQMADAIDQRLAQMSKAISNRHGESCFKVVECPLRPGGSVREWTVCNEAAALAQDFLINEEGKEPENALVFFQEDGQLITRDGIKILAKDPHASGFPWRVAGLEDKDVHLLLLGCGGLARAALKQNAQAEHGKIVVAVEALVHAADKNDKEKGLPPAWKLPDNVCSNTSFPRGDMLKHGSVESWAGNMEDLKVPRSVDLCDMPQSVAAANDSAKALAKAVELAKVNIQRSREAAVTQRLALELETIAFIGSVFLDLIPVPKIQGGVPTWMMGFSPGDIPVAQIQRQTLEAVVQLACIYAHCWQNVDNPTRAMDSERALVGACMMCVFDVVARMRIPDAAIVLPELLREDGGYSVGLGMCTNQRPLEEVFARMELIEPEWLIVRRDVLAYLCWLEKNTQKHIFDFRMPTQFEVRKYSSTVVLLRKALERKGLEVVPRDGPQMSEMESLMEYLFGRFRQLADACPEMYWLRDMCLLFKFLCTMETRMAQLLRKRKDVNEYQFWRLTFDTDSAMRPTGMGWHDNVPSIFWEVQGIRGQDQDIADVSANAFGREISLGEGIILQSPADVSQIVERPNPSEDDILHTDGLPNFQDTLSPEESEALLCFLTVPYLQIPLVLDFFASQDRATYLFNPSLQALLRAVLFEPRSYQESGNTVVSYVPNKNVEGGIFDEKRPANEEVFGTPCGLLLSELSHCPGAVLEPLQAIFESTNELTKAEVYSSEAPYLLFMLELAIDILNFVKFVIDIMQQPARPDWVGNAAPDAHGVLERGRVFLIDYISRIGQTVSNWEKQASGNNDVISSCIVHSYMALEQLSTNVRVDAMSCWAFVRIWHNFGSVVEQQGTDMSPNERLRRFLQAQGIDTKKTSDLVLDQFTRDEGRFRPVFLRLGQQTIRVPTFRKQQRDGTERNTQPPGNVPEGRVFRLVQKKRRALVNTFLESPSESLTQVATVALRSQFDPGKWTMKTAGVFVAGDLQVNVQTGEILWREDGLKPLPDSMTRFEDFETIFGESSLQCGVVSRAKHRLWVHLVGRNYDLMEWDPSSQSAFKQGVAPVSREEATNGIAAQICRICGSTGKCWTCERCTMINCKSNSTECSTCGSQRERNESEDEALGLQQYASFFPGRRRAKKLKPVDSCVFNGKLFKRVLDIYAEEPPEVPEHEQWAINLLLPVVETLFPPEPEASRLRYKLLLPEMPLRQSDEEMVILGFDVGPTPGKQEGNASIAESKEDENKAATWKEIVISKVHESVSVFNWIPHGRRLYRSVVFCSKSKMALHNLQLDSPDAQKIRGAAGIFSSLRVEEGSLCIFRTSKELGICEQYVSPRLLRGIVPSALLEAYSFWEGEDGLIRGVPNSEQSAYFAKNLEIQIQDSVPATFIVRRLLGKFQKPEGDFKGLARPERNTSTAKKTQFREVDVLQLMELGFSQGACRLALEKCHGDSAAAAGWLFDESNMMAIFSADAEGTPMAVDADDDFQRALKMSMEDQEDTSTAMKVDESVSDALDDIILGVESTLVDLVQMQADGDMASLTKLLVRLEDLSHILVWAKDGSDVSLQTISSIELPRLKLTLVPNKQGLLVKDSGGWTIKSDLSTESLQGAALDDLLKGLHQTLILENGSRELQVLVANHDVTRPMFKGDPFTTKLLFNRSSFGWQEVMDNPYYIYPLHTTLTFLQSKSLAATLYLALLRLMSRQYKEAYNLLEGCWTDTPLLAEEQWVFNQFAGTLEDGHPDAHAVRCKLALCTAFVEDVTLPFELHLEMDQYLAKRAHVSLDLQISEEEELQLLRLCTAATSRVKARLEYLSAKARDQDKVILRLSPAQHGGQPWSKLCSQSLQALTQATRITRLQFKHPGLPENNQQGEWPDRVGEDALMKIIWEDTLLQDDESGVNRQLGFIFLYMVLSGQMSLTLASTDVSSSLGLLLLRLFHLKIARWGKEVVEDGEADVQVSRQMATLALMSRAAHAGWPPVPSGSQERRTLANGQNLYDAQGRESTLKFWLDAVDQLFAVTLGSLGIPTILDTLSMDDWAPPVEINVRGTPDTSHRHRPCDDQCARREAPIDFGSADLSTEVLAEFDIARFISRDSNPEKIVAELPFNLKGHSSTRTAVAGNLLERLAHDCKTYAERLNSQPTIVVCRLSQIEIQKIARRDNSSAHGAILTELNDLHQILVRHFEQDSVQIQRQISATLLSANALTAAQEKVFDFRIRRDLCRLESKLNFEYIIQCMLSSTAVVDLGKVNPHGPDFSKLLAASSGVALLAGRVQLASRAALQCRQIIDMIGSIMSSAPGNETKVLADTAILSQLASTLGETLTTCRCYFHNDGEQWYDPRYLVFEYMQRIVLRPRQVEMVDWFVASQKQGLSRVQQMIMGAGKTTVVGPLLSLILANRDTMVTQVMPSPLLDQTRQILRTCFSAIIPKRIATFSFDRQVEDCSETVMKIYWKLEACRKTCGVVVSSPEAIKSMLLKFIEQLNALATFDFSELTPGASMRTNRDLARTRDILAKRSEMSDAVVKVMQIWKLGILIMDEVDVLLHPLKSELNFPIGFRNPIDLSGHRWDMPIHIIDALFYASTDGKLFDCCPLGTVSSEVQADEEHPGHGILAELQEAIQQGYASHALQRTPHIVLLDNEFYHKVLKQVFAKWLLLWVKKNFVGTCGVADDLLLKYMQADMQAAQQWKHELERGLTPFSLKLLNLASNWIRAILPHVLSKIDRVSYGLLDGKQLKAADAKAPFSRLVMAVPFVGKDVPSRSSEFAHPDVVIGLSVFAYRYEGLRSTDARSIVMQLKQDVARELGPRDTRPAHKMFESWVRRESPTTPRHKMRRIDSNLDNLAQNILPLSLFQPSDPSQMARLYKHLRFSPAVAHFWLRQHVFPATMNFHPMKLSASGHELGSSLLFGHRVGFSGTPSNLLPGDLGECFYEPGSDGQVIHVLTNPCVTTAEVCSTDWTPLKLLQQVAQHGAYHAFIDTGALITNMDNEQVARELLQFLPTDLFDGVVFLDHNDRKMILLRSTTSHHRAVALVSAGVTPERRFTFFDQIHTTGMDILTAPCAKAVVTIGKDMTFRDYAQGAFRMRKVGKGQTIHICVIPEVRARIDADLGTIRTGQLILDVPAWLLVNSCRSESLQSLKLLSQEVMNGWRKHALQALISEVVAHAFVAKHSTAERMRRYASGPEAVSQRACLGTFREKIGFDVDDTVAPAKPFLDALMKQCEEHAQFCVTEDDHQRQKVILDQVARETQLTDHADMQYGFTAEVVHEQEAEQQQEQEEEQEEEQESAFTRDDEQANPWNVSVLVDSPPDLQDSKQANDKPFYQLSAFQLRPEHPKLPVSKNLWLTDNFFRPRWAGMGDRKLKSAFVVLEWHPELSKEWYKKGVQTRVKSFFAEELTKASGDATKAAINALSRAKESMKGDPLAASEVPGLKAGEHPRYIVILTLAEAETLRWILRAGAHPISKTVGFALRISTGRSLDQSAPFIAVPSPQEFDVSSLLCILRLFNSDMFFQEDQLMALELQLKDVPLITRQTWFEECLRLRRRRTRHVWMDTPVAKLFTPQEEWSGLRCRAMQKGIQKALRERARIEDVEMLLQPEWRHDALRNHLLRMRLGFSAGDLSDAVKALDVDNRGLIPADLLENAFQIQSALLALKDLAGLREARRTQEETTRLEKASQVWQCQNCTFINSALSSTCAVCDYGWTGQRECPPDKWCCTPATGGCTFFNSKTLFYCDVCGRARPDMASFSF